MQKKVISGVNDLATTHPHLVLEWDYEHNGNLTPSNVCAHSKRIAWWTNSSGHVWAAPIYSRANGVGCPYEAGKLHSPEKLAALDAAVQSLAHTHPTLAAELVVEHNLGLRPADITAASSKNVFWRCSKGHIWQASIAKRASGKGDCPYCRKESVVNT